VWGAHGRGPQIVRVSMTTSVFRTVYYSPQMVQVSTTTEGTKLWTARYLRMDKWSGKLGFKAREHSLS
jgi:hypothetical protein